MQCLYFEIDLLRNSDLIGASAPQGVVALGAGDSRRLQRVMEEL